MGWVSGTVVYFLIWWTALFAVLPWGVQRDTTLGTGAPVNARLKEKFIATSIVSAVIWLVVWALMAAHIVDWRAIAMGMMDQDVKAQ